jgi:ABC-type phosphate transport system permease subunit
MSTWKPGDPDRRNENMQNDERTKEIASVVAKTVAETTAAVALEFAKSSASTTSALALLSQDMNYVRKDLSEVKERMEKSFVTSAEFNPVRNIVYGLVAIILVTVIGAILALVIIQRPHGG